MSMKRSKARATSSGRDQVGDSDFWAKPVAPERSWAEQMAERSDSDPVAYALDRRFAKDELVLHAKFGRGIVVDADASRVEILFEDGKKKLGHGQG